jgi:AcrR family transcriptional regulator
MKASKTRSLASDHDAVEALGVGGPRSEATRRAIVDAARAIFASHGYTQTTIRAVAADAGIDASMVMRYFGSKAGLFAAAASVSLEPPDLRSVPARRRGELLVRHFVDRWERTASADNLVLLLQAGVTDDAVGQQVQTNFDRMIAAPVAALGDPDADRRSALIVTQLVGLAVCRYILHTEPLASMSIEEIVADLSPTIQRYLTRPIARGSGTAPNS